MEKKHKKRMIQVGMIGFFGYWLGRIFWEIAADGDYVENSIAGFIIAAVAFVLFEGYIAWKKPKLKAYEKVLDQDERLNFIKLKATMVSSYFVKILILAAVLFYDLNGKPLEAMVPAILFIAILLIEGIAYVFYKRRI